MKLLGALLLLSSLFAFSGNASADEYFTAKEFLRADEGFDHERAIGIHLPINLQEEFDSEKDELVPVPINRTRSRMRLAILTYEYELASRSRVDFSDWRYLYESGPTSVRTRLIVRTKVNFWNDSSSALILDLNVVRPASLVRLSYKF